MVLDIWGHSLIAPGLILELLFFIRNHHFRPKWGEIEAVPVHSWKPDKAHDYFQMEFLGVHGKRLGFRVDLDGENGDFRDQKWTIPCRIEEGQILPEGAP